MGGSMETGYCEYCGEIGPINRKYYHYGVKCECCSPEHFELIFHCDECEPVDPGIRRTILTKEQKHIFL